ncbi:uncharacterized protein PHALS_04598 [Plasmopara halstedii]|uniref:Uncharacterized protein n=1 Tax=Plasmopara halstedii TaxID=4781 RepID=A0A0P1A9B2_PLAHL|nr:uncharacterized protein PHALS_04598 [Plasmopara halstedii]CEG37148.1 hypothetical protein PHALS_04598 [Plasmopara halstedii]|eukprot:XP_024573517.1 hypothetical protein PHALS_04598 [Plasmopara halstedii]
MPATTLSMNIGPSKSLASVVQGVWGHISAANQSYNNQATNSIAQKEISLILHLSRDAVLSFESFMSVLN